MRLFKPVLFVSFALVLTLGFYAALSFFERQKPPPAPIRWIAQTGPLKEALKTDYLAELLSLSEDQPRFLSVKEAEQILRSSPLIRKASVSLLNPETLYIDYTVRTPQFILGDVENLAVDQQGKTFPLSPFYTPKRLPTLYLGDGDHQEKQKIAKHLLQLLGEEVEFIDVSKSFHPSLGQREVVVGRGTHLLRLTPKHYEQELSRYQKIREEKERESLIIDLRISSLAFISTMSGSFP